MRELKLWAKLACALCSRGRPFASALLTSFNQVYLMPETQASVRELASAAFAACCSPSIRSWHIQGFSQQVMEPLAEAPTIAGELEPDLVLYRPAVWPLALSVASFAADAPAAAASRDLGVLLGHLAAMSARDVQRRMATASVDSRAVAEAIDAAGLAACMGLPTSLLLQTLHGDSISSAPAAGAPTAVTGRSAASWAAEQYQSACNVLVACHLMVDRCSSGDLVHRLALADALLGQLGQLAHIAARSGGAAAAGALDPHVAALSCGTWVEVAIGMLRGILSHPLALTVLDKRSRLAASLGLLVAQLPLLSLDPVFLFPRQQLLLAEVVGTLAGMGSTDHLGRHAKCCALCTEPFLAMRRMRSSQPVGAAATCSGVQGAL